MYKSVFIEDEPTMITGLKKAIDKEEYGYILTDSDQTGSFIINNVLKYMQENYNKHLMLNDVADAVFISRWHLSKLLKKHTGQSFSETLNKIRISKAKFLLKDPSLRICDVSELCGFSDAAHFSKIFKKYEGKSATEFRNTISA